MPEKANHTKSKNYGFFKITSPVCFQNLLKIASIDRSHQADRFKLSKLEKILKGGGELGSPKVKSSSSKHRGTLIYMYDF